MNFFTTINSFQFAGLSEQRSDARSSGKSEEDDVSDQIRRLRCRILIVDDSDAFRKSFAKRLCDVYKAVVDTAANASSAREKLTEMNAFDIVFLDVDMPEEDGIEACQRMRNDGVVGRIVLMSSEGENENRARAIKEEFLDKADDAGLEAILMGCKGERSRD